MSASFFLISSLVLGGRSPLDAVLFETFSYLVSGVARVETSDEGLTEKDPYPYCEEIARRDLTMLVFNCRNRFDVDAE